jgi:flagellar biosynthetic protein FliR
MELTDDQVLTWLGHFLWPFLRITGLFITAPLFGSSYIPAMVKAITAAALAAALALWLPDLAPFPGDPISAIYQGIVQITYGGMLGLTMQIIVSAVAGAGEIAGLSIGLGFAELQFREANTPTPILYDIMYWAGTIAFIATGGPVMLFAGLAHSFQSGTMITNLDSWNALTSLGSNLLTASVWLAMPVLAVAMAINITVGLTTIFAPQMNLLTIGFPILILAGLWIFASSIPFMGRDFHQLMTMGTHALLTISKNG